MARKKLLGEIVIEPVATTRVSVTASGPWGDEEKEFIYPGTSSTASVTTSLAYELGTSFQPKDKKQIVEIIDHTKKYISEFEIDISRFKLKFKREPQKTIKIFKETDG